MKLKIEVMSPTAGAYLIGLSCEDVLFTGSAPDLRRHMFTGTLVGRQVGHTDTLQIIAGNTPFIRILLRLVSLHPHDFNPSRKRGQGPAFQIPAFWSPASSSESVKAGDHTFAITNKRFRPALFKHSDGSQELSSIDGLLQPRKGQPNTFTSVTVVANATSTKVRIATASARTIRPRRVNDDPGDQSRFVVHAALEQAGDRATGRKEERHKQKPEAQLRASQQPKQDSDAQCAQGPPQRQRWL
eukprot:330166-Amphidinium_carterae.1